MPRLFSEGLTRRVSLAESNSTEVPSKGEFLTNSNLSPSERARKRVRSNSVVLPPDRVWTGIQPIKREVGGIWEKAAGTAASETRHRPIQGRKNFGIQDVMRTLNNRTREIPKLRKNYPSTRKTYLAGIEK